MLQRIFEYFPALNEKQREQLALLYPLYKDWNEKINVVSRKDIDNLYERHILHSLAIAKAVSFVPEARVADIGTGGGLPGIPLAIIFPQTEFLLVDSIGKKIKVAQAITDELGLTNVQTLQARAEALPAKRFDFVLARGVTALPQLWGWSVGLIRKEQWHDIPNGLLALKGDDETLRRELTELPGAAKLRYHIFPLPEWYSEPFFEGKCLLWLGRG